jgi:hypothetical protein
LYTYFLLIITYFLIYDQKNMLNLHFLFVFQISTFSKIDKWSYEIHHDM